MDPLSSYDAIPYAVGAFSAAAPQSMAFAAWAHGGPLATLGAGTRVLELGCGDGSNLLPLAFHHPDWSLHGVDLSAGAIERGEAGRAALGIDNLSFARGDVASFTTDDRYDFVIAHGLYSWLPSNTRASLRQVIRAALRDGGLAYVSFNAQPGWGVRGRVRDVLLRAQGATLDLAAARALAANLLTMLEVPGNRWDQMLSQELTRIRDAKDGYLAHEYLAPSNDAFWLGEVVDAFAEVELCYAGDALFDRIEGFVSPTRRQQVEALGGDSVRQQEMLDLVEYRQFRAALFTNSEFSGLRGIEMIDECFVAAALARRSDPFELRRGALETFDGPRGGVIELDQPLSKMALLVLADRYPQSFRFAELVDTCERRLEQFGIQTGAEDRTALRADLYQLFDHLEAELRVDEPPLRVVVRDRPSACRLSRLEATRGDVLTTPLHSGIPLEPIDHAILTHLDGDHTADEVATKIALAVDEGALDLEGAPAGMARLQPVAAARVESLVTRLGWWGLLD